MKKRNSQDKCSSQDLSQNNDQQYDIQGLCDEVLQNQTIPALGPRKLILLQEELHDYMDICVNNQDYTEASNAEKLLKQIRRELNRQYAALEKSMNSSKSYKITCPVSRAPRARREMLETSWSQERRVERSERITHSPYRPFSRQTTKLSRPLTLQKPLYTFTDSSVTSPGEPSEEQPVHTSKSIQTHAIIEDDGTMYIEEEDHQSTNCNSLLTFSSSSTEDSEMIIGNTFTPHVSARKEDELQTELETAFEIMLDPDTPPNQSSESDTLADSQTDSLKPLNTQKSADTVSAPDASDQLSEKVPDDAGSSMQPDSGTEPNSEVKQSPQDTASNQEAEPADQPQPDDALEDEQPPSAEANQTTEIPDHSEPPSEQDSVPQTQEMDVPLECSSVNREADPQNETGERPGGDLVLPEASKPDPPNDGVEETQDADVGESPDKESHNGAPDPSLEQSGQPSDNIEGSPAEEEKQAASDLPSPESAPTGGEVNPEVAESNQQAPVEEAADGNPAEQPVDPGHLESKIEALGELLA